MDKNKEKRLRKKIRGIIKELFDSSSHYTNYPGAGDTFPYFDQSAPVKPNEIDPDINYFISLKPYDEIDIKKFPFKQFRKGIKYEKEENPDLSYFDIAQSVINNLQQDKKYYSDLSQNDEDQGQSSYYTFRSFAGNDDVYEFPYKEFKKGLKIEKGRNPQFDFLSLGEIVIDNLREDKYFYSNLIQAKYQKNSFD